MHVPSVSIPVYKTDGWLTNSSFHILCLFLGLCTYDESHVLRDFVTADCYLSPVTQQFTGILKLDFCFQEARWLKRLTDDMFTMPL